MEEEGVESEEVEVAGEDEADVDVDGAGDVEVEEGGDGEVIGNGLDSARNLAVVSGDILPCLSSFSKSTNSTNSSTRHKIKLAHYQ